MKEKKPAKQNTAGNRDYRILVLLVAGLLAGLVVFVDSAARRPFSKAHRLPESPFLTKNLCSTEQIPDDLRPFFFLPVRLNSADQRLIESIPGVGPGLAIKIINLRNERNGFADLNELLDVDGIGPKRLVAFRRYCSL